MDIKKILKVAVRGGASDIILKVGSVPRFRLVGNLITLSEGVSISEDMMSSWLEELIPVHLRDSYSSAKDIDFSYETPWGYRFRINVFFQMQKRAMVLRVIPGHVKTMEELQLPPFFGSIAALKRGLVLITGATGSGKTTSLAAVVEKINQTRAGHVLTIEDPIEFVFKDALSTVSQREVGLDTGSFADALRAGLRQNPDVIFVGELRDRETIEVAMLAAETGHLVLSTLHTQSAYDSLLRILSHFDATKHSHICQVLSATLAAVVSQRLIPRCDIRGLVPALEILAANDLVRHLILEGRFSELPEVIKKADSSYGMQTFDQSLISLLQRGVISEEVAMLNASKKTNMDLVLKGVS